MMLFDIALHELRRLLLSPLAWLTLALVQFLLAVFFYLLLSKYLQTPQVFAGKGLTEIVVVGTLQIGGPVLLAIIPFLTMRLFSEERRSGAMKLLLSSPVSSTELVLGKYLGIVLLLMLLLNLIALLPLSLFFGTRPDVGQLAAAFLGLALLLFTLAAIGLFISTLTRQPAVAAIVTFGVLLGFWIIHFAANTDNQTVAAVMAYLSLMRHYDNMLEGVFSSVDLCYFLLLSTVFLVLSIWRLDSLRTQA